MMRRDCAGVIVGALAAALLAGCLEFDEQTVYVEHDQAGDRLVIVIDYKGLFEGGKKQGMGGGDAVAQLAEAVEKRTVAVFDNWPFALSVEEVRAKLAEPPEEGDELPAEVRADALKLLERMEVLNGGFYLDGRGRPCGTQVVILREAADCVEIINRLITSAVLKNADEFMADADPTPRLIVEHARRGHKWLALKGHSLVVSVPVAEADVADGRAEFIEGLVDSEFTDDAHRKAGFRALLASQVFVWHEDDMLRVKVGLDRHPARLTTRPAMGGYEPNLVEHVRETYGLKLDGLLARYLAQPDAPTETEGERAGKTIAPRLAKPDLVRVLVRALKAGPSEALWTRLRELAPADDQELPAEPTDEQLLAAWEEWLEARVPEPAEAEAEPVEPEERQGQ